MTVSGQFPPFDIATGTVFNQRPRLSFGRRGGHCFPGRVFAPDGTVHECRPVAHRYHDDPQTIADAGAAGAGLAAVLADGALFARRRLKLVMDSESCTRCRRTRGAHETLSHPVKGPSCHERARRRNTARCSRGFHAAATDALHDACRRYKMLTLPVARSYMAPTTFTRPSFT